MLKVNHLIGFGRKKLVTGGADGTRRAIIIEDEDNGNTGSGLEIDFASGSGNAQATIMFWVQWNNHATTGEAFATMWASDTGAEQIYAEGMAATGGDVTARAGGGNPLRTSTNNPLASDSTWAHVCAQYDHTAETVELFTNGTSAGTTTNPAFTLQCTAAGQHWVGQDDGADYDWPGRLFDVLFFDGSLVDPGAAASNYSGGSWQNPTSPSYGTMGYRLDGQNTGNPGHDTSGNANHFSETTASRITLTASGLPTGA